MWYSIPVYLYINILIWGFYVLYDIKVPTVQYYSRIMIHDLTVLKVYEYINSRIIVVSIEVGTMRQ